MSWSGSGTEHSKHNKHSGARRLSCHHMLLLQREAVTMQYLLLLLLLQLGILSSARALPIVDPGLFVILGVRTCGAGGGYCLLGSDCTLDRDFEHDTTGGHCDGLRFAFTPAAHFVCCRYVERSNTTLPGEPGEEFTTTEDPGLVREASESSTSTKEATSASTLIPTPPPPGPTATDLENAIEVEAVVELAGMQGDSDNSTVSTAAPSESADVLNGVDDEDVEGQQQEHSVLVAASAASCRNSSSGEVNPCWRTSFQDRSGAVLCSGSMVGVESAVTTAVCANRLLDAGVAGVSMRVAESWLPVRDVAVHEGYHPQIEEIPNSSLNDIAVVRLLSAPGPAPGPSSSCIACLPPASAGSSGTTCFALAARFNGLGEESSAVCAGSVVSAGEGLLRLSGCEVASLKSGIMKGQAPAVQAREGAALLCEGALVGLASTSVGRYMSLVPHTAWLSRTLSATRTVTDNFFRA